MSTLTKVLIVLQTVFTIFLCGIVVTYVGNADNYKADLDTARSQASQAKSRANGIQEDWDQYKADHDKAMADAKAAIAELQTNTTSLEQALAAANREKGALLQRVEGIAAKMDSNASSTEKMRAMYATAQQTLDDLRAEETRLKQDLKETNDVLIEKLAIIENKMREFGFKPADAEPVTASSSGVQPANPVLDIALKGRITDLDLETALAEISIGSEAGVKERMKFHVTRGEDYLCDLSIVAVDTDKAVGSLEMIQGTPRVGDPRRQY